uniref:DUF38 domain-containing protein n=1 Tax=Panagrolaimus sp. ES5 TaxID=591445 RepID=A0AC34F9W4_9BILA
MDDKMEASASSKSLIRGKISWPESLSLKQSFSLPESVMYYMAMNPSTPEVYNKLIQCCKYFFEKNPILVAARMRDDTTICSDKYCSKFFRDDDKKCCVNLDITKTSSKLWLTHELHLHGNDDASTFIPLLTHKLFRYEIQNLTVNKKIITIDVFKFLASSPKSIRVYASKIIDSAGNTVMLETLLENMYNVKYFTYAFLNESSMINASTLSTITKQKNFGQLLSFKMFFIPEVFSVEDLSAFLNAHKTLEILFDFDRNISEDYANQLDGLVDAVIESERNNLIIWYRGQDRNKRKIMEKIVVCVDKNE